MQYHHNPWPYIALLKTNDGGVTLSPSNQHHNNSVYVYLHYYSYFLLGKCFLLLLQKLPQTSSEHLFLPHFYYLRLHPRIYTWPSGIPHLIVGKFY